MAEIDEKKFEELLKKLNEQVSQIADRKALPKLTDDELRKIKQYTDEIKNSTKSIEDLANAQEDYSRLVGDSVERLKEKYKSQYEFLTEAEKKLEIEINIRQAAQLKTLENIKAKENELTKEIEEQADAFDKLIEKQKELNAAAKERADAVEDERKAIKDINRMGQMMADTQDKINTLKRQQAFAVRPDETLQIEIENEEKKLKAQQKTFDKYSQNYDKVKERLEERRKLEAGITRDLIAQKNEVKKMTDFTDVELDNVISLEEARKRQMEKLEGDRSKELGEMQSAAATQEDELGLEVLQQEKDFRDKITGGIKNQVAALTGVQDRSEGILDSLVDSLYVNGELVEDEEARAAAGKKAGIAMGVFKEQLEGSLKPAKALKVLLSQIKSFVGTSKDLFKETFMGAQSLAVQLAETDITFVRETGLLREFGNELENLKYQANDLRVTNLELDTAFQGLSKSSMAFTTLSTSQRSELAMASIAFERFGGNTEDLAQSVDNLRLGFGKSVPSILRTTDEISRFGMAIGIGAGAALQQFNQNIDLLARFGEEKGAQVFKELAAQAKASGVEINKLRQAGKTFDTFEGAMRGAGKLNFILKGPFLNSMKMLRANDAERINMLRDALEQSGQTFESLGRRGREAFAEAAGFGDDVMAAQRALRGETKESQKALMDGARKQMAETGKLTDSMEDQLTMQQKDTIAKEHAANASRALTEAMVTFNEILIDIKDMLAPVRVAIGAVAALITDVLIPAVVTLVGMGALGGFVGFLRNIPGLSGGFAAALTRMGQGLRSLAGIAGRATLAIGGVYTAYDAFKNVDKEESTGGKAARIAEGAAGGAMMLSFLGPKGMAAGAAIGGLFTAGKLLFANSGGVVGTDKLKPIGGMGNVAATVMGDLPGGRLTNVSEMAMLPHGSSVLKAPDVANLTESVKSLPSVIDNINQATGGFDARKAFLASFSPAETKKQETTSGSSFLNLGMKNYAAERAERQAKEREARMSATQPTPAPAPPAQEIRQPIIIKLEMDRKPIAEVAQEIAIKVANAAAGQTVSPRPVI